MRELLRQLLMTLLFICLVILDHVVVPATAKTTPNEDEAAEVMNRAALSLLLKANTPTNTGSLTSTNKQNANTPIEVSETRDTNGVSLFFRFNGATHCLSTRLQCSGKSYSVTK
jgi:hypothetical protein